VAKWLCLVWRDADTIRRSKVGAISGSAPATPLISSVYLPHPAAKVTGVPYCERHREAIKVFPPKEMLVCTPWKYLPGYEQKMEEHRNAFLK